MEEDKNGSGSKAPETVIVPNKQGADESTEWIRGSVDYSEEPPPVRDTLEPPGQEPDKK